MFNSRKSSAKPEPELLANFRQQFPQIVSTAADSTISSTAHDDNSIMAPNQLQAAHDFRDLDPTPRANLAAEQWRFTPHALGDFSFTGLGGAPHGYYTPTPGGSNTFYHPQAGDLHTPSIMTLNTPLSMSTSQNTIHGGTQAMVHIPMPFQTLHPEQLHMSHMIQPMAHPQQPAQLVPSPPQPSAFPPASFIHNDTGYESMDQDMSPIDSDHSERMASMAGALQSMSPMSGAVSPQQSAGFVGLPAGAEKLRFLTTLNAATAMVRDNKEAPATYLNKGQTYSLTIKDCRLPAPIAPGTRYRTCVRVSFEEEPQRRRPEACWKLWTEGRGSDEAYQRGGKFLAIEYAAPTNQKAEGDDTRARIEPEGSSLDSFSVIWTPAANGEVKVNINMCFYFLSTDFSHSKGVRGIALRLCSKTALLPGESSVPSPPSTALDTTPELCYCQVKLFRDHGAERKLTNDTKHVQMTIEKLRLQIEQAEHGIKDFAKRKRSQVREGQHPNRVTKHKRTWSISSASSAGGGGGGRILAEDDLRDKMERAKRMLNSHRPFSVLYLRGDEFDDPDLHPLPPTENAMSPIKVETADRLARQMRSGHSSAAGSSLVSPTPSSPSLASQASAIVGGWVSSSAFDSDHQRQPARVKASGQLNSWIEALGVDPVYRPPVEQPARPVACLYIQRHDPSPDYHHAVYLGRRTKAEFVERVAAKWGLDASRVARCVYLFEPPGGAGSNNTIEVAIDDDFVQQLPEAQAMALEVVEVSDAEAAAEAAAAAAAIVGHRSREWETEMSLDLPDIDDDDDKPLRQRPLVGGDLVFRFKF